jgi:bla regulator protein blaR1
MAASRVIVSSPTVDGGSTRDFADAVLSRLMNRVVIDKTGEAGLFDLHFEFTPDDATPLGGAPLPVSPAGENDVSIFTALEEQLGLKLESSTGPVVLVIDRAERPSEN